jgi:hypothetical protein
MDRKDAEKIVESFLKASALCDESLRLVKVNDSLGQAKALGRLVGAFLGHTYTNILGPLWRGFPDLEPARMKESPLAPELVLHPASREALRAFLAQAHTALRTAEHVIPEDERDAMFAFGGLREVKTAITEIEHFLASPQHRAS